MTCTELIEELRGYPGNAHIVIAGEIVTASVLKWGRTSDGYMNKQFSVARKGRECAVMFMRHTEVGPNDHVELVII